MYKAQHIVVVSEDAMVYDDLEELQYMPCFGRILPQALFLATSRANGSSSMMLLKSPTSLMLPRRLALQPGLSSGL